MIRCSNCSALFDALRRLSEMPPNRPATAPSVEPSWTRRSQPAPGYWGLILVLALIALTGQTLYFEGKAATQNETVRPWLEKICARLNCVLPDYRNLDDFAVIQSALTPTDSRQFIFQAVIHNQALFPQRPPNLRLTFMRLNGEPFAQRIFRPEDYMVSPSFDVEPDHPVEISLNIAPVETIVGGYTLELI